MGDRVTPVSRVVVDTYRNSVCLEDLGQRHMVNTQCMCIESWQKCERDREMGSMVLIFTGELIWEQFII